MVNSYLVANLLYKKISGGTEGPTEIKVDNSKLEIIFGDGNPDRLRIQLYNSWGGKNECIDITKVKLKKEPDFEDSVQGAEWYNLERGGSS